YDVRGVFALGVLAVVHAEMHVQVIGRVAQQLPAYRLILQIAALVLGPVLGVLVAGFGSERQPRGQSVLDQLAIDRALVLAPIVVADAGLQPAAVVERRLARYHVNGATGAVLTPQSALRPWQHLDPLDIVERPATEENWPEIDLIDIKTDRADVIQRWLPGTDTTQEPARETMAVQCCRRGIGNETGDFTGSRPGTTVRQLLATDGGDRLWYFLYRLLALLRTDHHRLQGLSLLSLPSRGLGIGGMGQPAQRATGDDRGDGAPQRAPDVIRHASLLSECHAAD